MLQHADSVVGFFSDPRGRLETLLLITSVLVWLGYLALRYSRKSRIPVVTAFLLLGIVVGPSALDLVSSRALDYLRIIEPVALGMIAFAAGERLRFADLAALRRNHYVAIALETLLPVALVATVVLLVTGRLELALPVGAIAGTTGLATVISTLKESGAKGNFTKILGTAVATDNVFAVVFFSLTLPLVVAIDGDGSAGALYLDGLVSIVASVVLGVVGGFVVSRSVRGVRSSHELSMLVLAYVLLIAGVTEYLHFSVLLAGLAMGTTAVNLTKEEKDRERVFAALGPLEYPVFAMFFLWAGASLHVRALGGIGWIFGVYVVGRAVGKLAGPVLASIRLRWNSATAIQSRCLGAALLPQAGAAVGLAVLARESLPGSGDLILATVLAAVVVFELVGPLGVHWAARRAGEVREWSSIRPLTLEEALKELEDRKPHVVVLRYADGPSPNMEMPQRMAARVHGDLIEIPVAPGFMGPVEVTLDVVEVATDGGERPPGSTEDPADPELPNLILDPRQLAGFLDTVAGLKPGVLFLSLPRKMRQLLGPADSLGERIGCPVFDLPANQNGRWVEAVSSRLAGADETVTRVLSRWRTDWQPRLAARATDRDKQP